MREPITWTPILTNQFNGWGAFEWITPRPEGERERYFYLETRRFGVAG